MPGTGLADLCLSWEEKLAPWLLPAQLRHIQAFGSSSQAIRARYTRLLARHMALNQTGWREALDRDAQGRPFFLPSHSPAAFAYARDAIFCLSEPAFRDRDVLAIDAVCINELPACDMLDFLRKIYPSLRLSIFTLDHLRIAALWTAFESAWKIIGKKVLEMDLPAIFPRNFTVSANSVFYLPKADLHFHFFRSGSYMTALATRQAFQSCISCRWLPRPLLPISLARYPEPLCSHA